MFGPNVKSDDSGIYYHHREDRFHNMLEEIEQIFVKKFGLDDYIMLFLTGSGTTANEAVIFSFKAQFTYLFFDAEFGRRLLRLSEAHRRNFCESDNYLAFPLYETSISRVNKIKIDYEQQITFLDMVSAFPYYLPPKNTAIWTTVSSKQIGAYPVLGIIAIRKDLLDSNKWFRFIPNSTLSIMEHIKFRHRKETLTTSAIPLYVDLLKVLRKFDRESLIRKIDERRERILNIIGERSVMGEGPVITFKPKSWLMPLADEFNLYINSSGNHQVFLWSGTNSEYEQLYKALEGMKA